MSGSGDAIQRRPLFGHRRDRYKIQVHRQHRDGSDRELRRSLRLRRRRDNRQRLASGDRNLRRCHRKTLRGRRGGGQRNIYGAGATNLPLYFGAYYAGGFGWKGSEDEVRLYNRALTSTEVSTIFNYTGAPDTIPPTVPANVLATAFSSTQINITWSASTDNVGVAGYRIFRNGTQVGATATLFRTRTPV